jgi:rRNA-processing protein FCF1
MTLQIVKGHPWDRKKFYVRRKRDYKRVTKNEIMQRLRLAKISTRQYGETGFAKDGTPIVADKVRTEMKKLKPIDKSKIVLTDDDVRSLQREMERKGIKTIYLPRKFIIKRRLPG